jgi:hypothetical protein
MYCELFCRPHSYIEVELAEEVVFFHEFWSIEEQALVAQQGLDNSSKVMILIEI